MHVGVLAGGPSPEGEGSFLSAESASKALGDLGHTSELIDLSEPGFWSRLKKVDAGFIAGHGWYAEDGKLQGLLEVLGVPYTGPGVLASALGMHKPTFKQLLVGKGIPTLPWASLTKAASREEIAKVIDRLGLPLFAKPASNGESFEAGIIRSMDDLQELLTSDGLYSSHEYIVEPFATGNTLTIGILQDGDRLIPLPVLEAVSHNEFYDAESKQNPDLHEYLCPAPVAPHITDRITELALLAWQACGCHGISRFDFMLNEQGPVMLEMNTVPGLTRQGNLAAMAEASGLGFNRIIELMLNSASNRPTYCP
ncbi:D-alanine--D-alanine ligase [Streptomyces sp. NPDC020965]|uniref:D-alanine--D-alanine ligase n=1 Tax=Streptomyces sp. NPDC020965 TaxID=3365105 RepID=UPI00378BAC2D